MGQLEACGARDAGVEQSGTKLAMGPNRRLNRFFLAGNFASIEAPNTYKSSQIDKDSSRDRGKNMEKQEDLTKRNTWTPKNSAMSIHGEPLDTVAPEAPEAPDTSLNRLSWA